MKKLRALITFAFICVMVCDASARGLGRRYGTGNPARNREEPPTVFFEGYETSLPVVHAPKYPNGMSFAKGKPLGSVTMTVNIDPDTAVTVTLDRNRTILDMMVVRNGKLAYSTETRMSYWRVWVEMDEWRSFVRTIPLFIVEP